MTIITNDPLRRDITLTIKGEFTRSVYVDPDELTYGQIAGTEPVTQDCRILCNLPNRQIKIQGYKLSDPSLEKFFQVDHVPLSADELRKERVRRAGSWSVLR